MQAILRENDHEKTSSFHVFTWQFSRYDTKLSQNMKMITLKSVTVSCFLLLFFCLGWQQCASVSPWFRAWFKFLRQTGNSSSHLHIVHLSPMPHLLCCVSDFAQLNPEMRLIKGATCLHTSPEGWRAVIDLLTLDLSPSVHRTFHQLAVPHSKANWGRRSSNVEAKPHGGGDIIHTRLDESIKCLWWNTHF